MQEMIYFFCIFTFFFVPLQRISIFPMEQGLNTYYYCVAQHLFAVHCADKALFERMSNYEPFRVEAQGEPIFALRIEQDGLLNEDRRSHYTHVFTDNSEEDRNNFKHSLTPDVKYDNYCKGNKC